MSHVVAVKKLHPLAILPVYATDGAGCFDIHALMEDGASVELRGEMSAVFRTGLAFEIPVGHSMFIFSRSGHGFNQAVRLANATGIIDHDYRGEVKVKLIRDSEQGTPLVVKHGDRIAQGVILPTPKVSFVELDELSETERGEGGFGSTG